MTGSSQMRSVRPVGDESRSVLLTCHTCHSLPFSTPNRPEPAGSDPPAALEGRETLVAVGTGLVPCNLKRMKKAAHVAGVWKKFRVHSTARYPHGIVLSSFSHDSIEVVLDRVASQGWCPFRFRKARMGGVSFKELVVL